MTTTNIVIISIAVLVVLLLLVLLILLLNLQGSKAPKKTQTKTTRRIHIQSLQLPSGIGKIPKHELQGAIPSSVLRVYQSLDYPKNQADFNRFQWHSWQVGMLLRVYQLDIQFPIHKASEIFPSEITRIDDKGLRQIVNDIMVKYRRDVDVNLTKDDLCKDLRWSGREVGILFLFLSRHHNM